MSSLIQGANPSFMSKRILFLADADSSHTMKWAIGLHQRGMIIAIFSLRKSVSGWNTDFPGIRIFDADAFAKEKFSQSDSSKISYLKFTDAVKGIIAEFKPDIVHAHYATSYGLLGVKTKFHPLVISAWGSDVFEFPEKSILHRYVVKRNLRKADLVFSTSEVMKKQIAKLGRKDAVVTPFGADLNVYKPNPHRMYGAAKVVGTIKTLEQHYGIDLLIQSFAAARAKYQGELKLVICGDGSQRDALEQLAGLCGCKDDIVFTGAIPQHEVPKYLNAFDVFVNLSRRESFGVSVIEAMACGVPVVSSDADGPKEISENGRYTSQVKTGENAASAILQLLEEEAAAKELALQALEHVKRKYNWAHNLDGILQQYSKLVNL